MSPKARREYISDMRRRYAAVATKVEHSSLLDEVVAMIGCHRKYAIALMSREQRAPRKRRRSSRYGPAVRAALTCIWRAASYPCSPRLKAMLPFWVPWLEQRLALDVQTRTDLQCISARSIDRLLRSKRGEVRRRLYGHTRPGSLLKHQIPIRAERWDVAEAGWSELDLVAHGGDSAGGEFINSLNLTDIASGWTETRAICSKGERVTVQAIAAIRSSLPFVLHGIDSDSGGEFINHHCVRYCESEPKLVFTRSRPYKKNDNAHVEQKNWTHVRKIFGWQRLAGECVAKAMNELYANELRLLMNYFQPSMKLIEKRRVGSRVTKKYDAPQTPLDRLIALGALEGERKATMLAERAALNPFELAAAIERKVTTILKMCEEQTLPTPCKRHGPPLLALSNRVVRVRRAAHGAR